MEVTTAIISLVVSCIFPIAECPVTHPSSSSLQYHIGENATFMWNSTKKIVGVKFGLKDANGDFCGQTIVIGRLTGVHYPNLTNTCAEGYAGRVQLSGDLLNGQAWFALTDLRKEDFNANYFVKIIETGNLEPYSNDVYLTLLKAPTIQTPTTTPAPTTTASTTTPNPKPWITPVTVTSVIVLVVVVIAIICYCRRKGMLKCNFLNPKRKDGEDNKTDNESGGGVQHDSNSINTVLEELPKLPSDLNQA